MLTIEVRARSAVKRLALNLSHGIGPCHTPFALALDRWPRQQFADRDVAISITVCA
jgi:hypothetical protein